MNTQIEDTHEVDRLRRELAVSANLLQEIATFAKKKDELAKTRMELYVASIKKTIELLDAGEYDQLRWIAVTALKNIAEADRKAEALTET